MGAGPAQGSGHSSGLPAPAKMADGPTPAQNMCISEDRLSKGARRTSLPPKATGGFCWASTTLLPPALPLPPSQSAAQQSLGQGSDGQHGGASHAPRSHLLLHHSVPRLQPALGTPNTHKSRKPPFQASHHTTQGQGPQSPSRTTRPSPHLGYPTPPQELERTAQAT